MTERIWAPWRIRYLTQKNKTCLFCKASKSKNKDRKNFVILRSKYSFSMLNLFPYNNGHVMVSPYRHIKDTNLLTNEEIVDLFGLIKKSKKLLDKVLKPHSYNLGINLGKSAGAGIEHLHVHLVPRWDGDTNFMPVVFDTKIISQSLDELYKKLKNA
ncbi:MAG: HIT domain-containing protein [Candidatus Omnitrophota bacterium]